MTLEAGKEMDRQCVMNWLNEVYVTPSRAFSKYTDDKLKMFAHDALVLLKEQEAATIKKTKEHGFGVYGGICPKCRNWIQSAHSFCGFCGQEVKWE